MKVNLKGIPVIRNLQRRILVAAVATVPFLLSSCQPASNADQSANPAPAPPKSTLGPESHKLLSCTDLLKIINQNPTLTPDYLPVVNNFELTINDVNPRDLKDKVRKQKNGAATNPWTDANATGKLIPTKWDFDAELGSPVVTGNRIIYQSALVTINLKKNAKMKFVASPDTIRAGDAAGQAMFCGLSSNQDIASFYIIYDPNSKDADNKKINEGSFNIGVIVTDNSSTSAKQFEMPLYFDPEVKNDG